MAPTYLRDILKISQKDRALRSNNKCILVVQKTATVKYGESSFSYAAPVLWNQLPEVCRMETDLNSFKSKLKTFLFKQVFN